MRALSFAFGLVMVAAATVQTHGAATVFAVVALLAVVVGLASRAAAVLAVLATVAVLAISDPAPLTAALAGVAATLYLVLRHAHPASLSVPTVLGAVGLSAVAVLGTAVPVALPWVPLVAPLAVVVIYVLVLAPLVG
jgi:hypothetical protein